MFFSWWTRRRRAKLQAQPFPPAWRDVLHRNVRRYERLSADERQVLEQRLQVFVAEKHWEGVGGLSLTDEITVTISALACLMVLGLDDQFFDNVLSILVYPTAYLAPGEHITRAGVVIKGDEARQGEAWYRGPVILSWEDALAGAREQTHGSNLVYHEFAHQLDMQNGRAIDGTPQLPTHELAERWPRVMEAAYQQLLVDCRGFHRPLLDCYGTTNRAEFFAVASEAFLCRPAALATRHPDLFDVLRGCYRQDPREARISRPLASPDGESG